MIRLNKYEAGLSEQGQQFLNKTTIPLPQFYCKSCKKLKEGNQCSCYQRVVNKNFNKCFNHSNYKPVEVVFKAPDNIDEIAYKHYLQTIA